MDNGSAADAAEPSPRTLAEVGVIVYSSVPARFPPPNASVGQQKSDDDRRRSSFNEIAAFNVATITRPSRIPLTVVFQMTTHAFFFAALLSLVNTFLWQYCLDHREQFSIRWHWPVAEGSPITAPVVAEDATIYFWSHFVQTLHGVPVCYAYALVNWKSEIVHKHFLYCCRILVVSFLSLNVLTLPPVRKKIGRSVLLKLVIRMSAVVGFLVMMAKRLKWDHKIKEKEQEQQKQNDASLVPAPVSERDVERSFVADVGPTMGEGHHVSDQRPSESPSNTDTVSGSGAQKTVGKISSLSSRRTDVRLSPVLRGWVLAAVGFFLFLMFFRVLRYIKNSGAGSADDEGKKMLSALIIWPILRETLLKITRGGMRHLATSDTGRLVELWLIPVNFLVGFVGRFLICELRDFRTVCLVILAQAVQEIVLRQTFHLRDRWIAVKIKRWPPAKIEEHFESRVGMRFRARVVIAEMYAEYIAIISAPFAMWIFAGSAYTVNFGYRSLDGGTDGILLLQGVLLSFAVEIIVDLLCCGVENLYAVPLAEVWDEVGFGILFRFPCRWVNVIPSARLIWPISALVLYCIHVYRPRWEDHCRSVWDGYTKLYFVCERECLDGLDYPTVYNEICGRND